MSDPAMEDDSALLSAVSLEAKLSEAPPPRVSQERTRAERTLQNDEVREISEIIKSIGTSDIKIEIRRITPQRYKNVQTSGTLIELDALPEGASLPMWVKENFGGGKFEAEFRHNGRFVTKKRFEVEGNPMIEKSEAAAANPLPMIQAPSVGDAAVTGAMDLVKDILKDKGKGSQVDPNMIEALTGPLKTQVAALYQQLQQKDQALSDKDRIIADQQMKIVELANKRPDTSGSDALVNKMLERGDSNVSVLQAQFASEKNMLMTSYNDEKKRTEDRADRERTQLINQHTRDMDNYKSMFEQQMRMTEESWKGRLEAKDSRIADLKREIERMMLDLDELRRRKEKGLVETLQEARGIQEMLGGLSPEKEEPSMMEQLGPVIQAVTQRLGQPATPPTPPPQQMRRLRKPAEAPATPPPAATPPAKIPASALGVEDAQVVMAVQAMEQALRNGIPADTFVSEVRPFIPPSVIVAIKKVGIDKILDDVASLEPDSPLQQVNGRSFARSVANMLTN
jgi:hypothetical protein